MEKTSFRWNSSNEKSDASIGSGCDIAPSVSWGRNVQIGNNVRIGANTVLLDNVVIGEGTSIAANCVIGEFSSKFYGNPDTHVGAKTEIGKKCVIRTGTLISENVRIGDEFQTGPYVSIREGCKIGNNCSIGNYSDIQPDVTLGNFTRLHSNVHMTEHAHIGNYVWIMPNCLFTNDNLFPIFTVPQPPTIGDYCVLGAGSFYYPGVKLGRHVVVAAGSKVKGIFGDFDFVTGDPAKRLCDARKFFVQIEGKPHFPYPWPKHITRNYPWKDIPPERRDIENF